MKILILAGGGGTRLWPLSRNNTPKQFQPLLNHKSLLQETANRARKLTTWKNIFVVAPKEYLNQIQKDLPQISKKNIILEPAPRNTAPCIGLGAFYLNNIDPEDVMVVLPSDHFIQDDQKFAKTIKKAIQLAKCGEQIVTLGIKPTYPETGYGYIRAGEKFGLGSFEVKKFLEKPNKAVAKRFINNGDYFWNSGMFVFRVDVILDAFENLMPRTYKALAETNQALKSKQTKKAEKAFLKSEKISIDYGIMEKFPSILVLPASFTWSDLGSFEALKAVLKKDSKGNAVTQNSILVDSKNCLIKNKTKKVVGLVGLKDVGIIETDDALLVCDLKQSQGVKDLVEKLKKDSKFKKFI
ncbi:mannose-1-phosphate guanylyltransferase [Patescibacteria group bacterium]